MSAASVRTPFGRVPQPGAKDAVAPESPVILEDGLPWRDDTGHQTPTESPHEREEGHSWRVTESPSQAFLRDSVSDQLNRFGFVSSVLVVPFLLLALLGRATSCWLVSMPGILWLCVPLCLRSATDLLRLWRHWDGRVLFVEEWPAIMIMRTSVMALVFACSFGAVLLAIALGTWGAGVWATNGSCPF